MEEIIDKDGQKYRRTRVKCNCICHNANNLVMHFMPCCDSDGYNTIEIPID